MSQDTSLVEIWFSRYTRSGDEDTEYDDRLATSGEDGSFDTVVTGTSLPAVSEVRVAAPCIDLSTVASPIMVYSDSEDEAASAAIQCIGPSAIESPITVDSGSEAKAASKPTTSGSASACAAVTTPAHIDLSGVDSPILVDSGSEEDAFVGVSIPGQVPATIPEHWLKAVPLQNPIERSSLSRLVRKTKKERDAAAVANTPSISTFFASADVPAGLRMVSPVPRVDCTTLGFTDRRLPLWRLPPYVLPTTTMHTQEADGKNVVVDFACQTFSLATNQARRSCWPAKTFISAVFVFISSRIR
ncbi:hypothetical protein B0H11DRAFT_2244313 [Mycena galericulata]|nr:hypothetical protein B0H11DRAFT_2244313 [Mycena galericulata]